jgi:hypothetical protein
MRRIAVGCLALLTGLVAACDDRTTPVATPEVEAAELRLPAVTSDRHFAAPLRGSVEVPPVTTNAVGMAGFSVRGGGTSIEFLLLIGRLTNTTMAHIHLAAAGTNGPVVAWLYPSAPPAQPIPGEFNGVLSQGTLTAANLVGPLAGQPLSALIEAMRAGNTYVNVHTSTFPGGEIRGQIAPLDVIDFDP